MSKPASPVEEYLPIKGLPEVLLRDHGLKLTTDNVRAIQQESARLSDGMFRAGCARASDIMAWLAAHPDFGRRKPKYGQSLGFAVA